MSASVFNPMLKFDLRHMRMSASARVTDNRKHTLPLPCRNLFGKVDDEECRQFVNNELEQTLILQSNYYEFDFKNDIPKSNAVRFVWEPMQEKLNIRPVKKAYPAYDNCEDISHLYFKPLNESIETMDDEYEPKMPPSKMKQCLITDYLKISKAGVIRKASQKSPHKSPFYSKKLITPTVSQLEKMVRARRIKS